jgi:hypothetical protein
MRLHIWFCRLGPVYLGPVWGRFGLDSLGFGAFGTVLGLLLLQDPYSPSNSSNMEQCV